MQILMLQFLAYAMLITGLATNNAALIAAAQAIYAFIG